MRLQSVRVFSLGQPKKGTPTGKRRYVVRWRVDGRDFKRRRKVKAEAERFRSQLITAVADGVRFDPSNGEPTTWSRTHLTWWEWSRAWYELKWAGWAGSSRKSGAEALVAFTPHLLRGGAPDPPEALRTWLWETGYVPDAEPVGPLATWLERWSIPLSELTPALLETALRAGTTKADGEPAAPVVSKRRRDLLNAALKAAVRRELVPSNPMDRVEWKPPRIGSTVDVTTLPTTADVAKVIEHVGSLRSQGARYAAFYSMLVYVGLRPSEAAALRVSDVDLPADGWGEARLRHAVPAPGRRYVAGEGTHELKSLKHRADGDVRRVPLPGVLVTSLRDHLETWPSVEGRLFSNANNRPVTAENYGGVWNRAKFAVWGEDHAAASITPYDLRHVAATMMLQAGVPIPEVARRLGHSADVLMRVYAGVFRDSEERSNNAIEVELNRQFRGGS